ncbi:MAG: polysaccharide biosynthesis tyrosine autokinase, partial [Verrucomicrobiota bacterium]|nr:polysaccharide biosynthesis tyrosine autokinase [Verrucomicrobiota bacterium]
LKGEDLMRALPTLEIQDPAVAKILPLYQDTVALEARYLQSGLGQNHPLVKANRAQKAVYQQQLDSQITSLRKSLETNARISENTMVMLEKKLGDLRAEQQSSRSKAADYIEAKARYIEAKKVLEGAQLKASTTTIEATMPQHPISIWENAEPATFPSKPNVKLNMLLACLVGLIVGIGIAFFVEYLDTSVKTMEDVESYLGVPVMAVVPNRIRLLYHDTQDSPDAEAYRILRTNIEFNRKKAEDNTITFVSGGPGEGKSTTVANLAYICAQGGYSVLVVDADLRRPTQHLLMEIDNDVGLGSYLNTDLRLDDVIVPTRVENLSLMPAGPQVLDPSGLLNSQRMSDTVKELKARYDIVLFDSPPILGVSDASVLASEADSTIIIVQHRRFPRSMLARVKQAVLKVGGNLIGVVLNNVDLKHDPESQYYTSYYNYYREPDNKRAKTIPKGAVKEPVEVGQTEDY